jgi:hypothetical protein
MSLCEASQSIALQALLLGPFFDLLYPETRSSIRCAAPTGELKFGPADDGSKTCVGTTLWLN